MLPIPWDVGLHDGWQPWLAAEQSLFHYFLSATRPMLRDITANEQLLYIVHPLIHPVYVLCWPNDADVGPTSSVQWMDVSCCLGKREAVATNYTLGHSCLGKSVVHVLVDLSVVNNYLFIMNRWTDPWNLAQTIFKLQSLLGQSLQW